ncbi:hypothetical protein Tco_1494765, partial [Tanacetum coccineum]
TVMSDSEDSTVTYTEVSSPFEDLSDIGSLEFVRPEYEGLPWMLDDPYVQDVLQAPLSPDYVPSPEEPEQAPPLLDFVPEPVYSEFMPPEDEVLPAEEQPLPAAASPTADSPGYVLESDPEEDPEEEDDDEDLRRILLIILPTEETMAMMRMSHPMRMIVALPAVDHAPSVEETEPFETNESAATPPPHPAYRVTAMISIQDEPPTPFWSDTEVARLFAIPTPPPSPLSPWSSPLPQIPSPPLPPILSPLPVSSPPPASPTYPLGYRVAMIRDTTTLTHTATYFITTFASTSADHGADRPEVCLPPWKRLCFAFGPRYEVGESSSALVARPTGCFRADYVFVATMDR